MTLILHGGMALNAMESVAPERGPVTLRCCRTAVVAWAAGGSEENERDESLCSGGMEESRKRTRAHGILFSAQSVARLADEVEGIALESINY